MLKPVRLPLKYSLPVSLSNVIFMYEAPCDKANIIIKSAEDAATLSVTCRTVNGNIVVAQNVSGVLSLHGLEAVDGSIIIRNNRGITSLSSDSLSAVYGEFILERLPNVVDFRFPQLSTVPRF